MFGELRAIEAECSSRVLGLVVLGFRRDRYRELERVADRLFISKAPGIPRRRGEERLKNERRVKESKEMRWPWSLGLAQRTISALACTVRRSVNTGSRPELARIEHGPRCLHPPDPGHSTRAGEPSIMPAETRERDGAYARARFPAQCPHRPLERVVMRSSFSTSSIPSSPH